MLSLIPFFISWRNNTENKNSFNINTLKTNRYRNHYIMYPIHSYKNDN